MHRYLRRGEFLCVCWWSIRVSILQWLVRHEFPDGLEIASAQSLQEAEALLAPDSPAAPDAAVVSLPPARLPWREFQQRCAAHEPPIPVLYESCIDADAGALGLEPGDGYAAFLRKPAARTELRSALEALLAVSLDGRRNGDRDRGAAPQRGDGGAAAARVVKLQRTGVAVLPCGSLKYEYCGELIHTT